MSYSDRYRKQKGQINQIAGTIVAFCLVVGLYGAYPVPVMVIGGLFLGTSVIGWVLERAFRGKSP